MRQLCAGCDLHGNNNLIAIVDGEGERVFKKKLPNELATIPSQKRAGLTDYHFVSGWSSEALWRSKGRRRLIHRPGLS
jgi:hypothetical protein